MAKIKKTKSKKEAKTKAPKAAASKVKKTSTIKKVTKVKKATKGKTKTAPVSSRSSKAVPVANKATKAKTSVAKTNNKQKPLSEREKRMQQIKIKLIGQKESLLNEAETALNELPGQTTFPDLGDQATAETDRNFMLRLRGREQRLLKKIDEAIDRIDSGIFGICEDCGQEIDIKRLEARPVTTMCINCKTLQEEEEKLREV